MLIPILIHTIVRSLIGLLIMLSNISGGAGSEPTTPTTPSPAFAPHAAPVPQPDEAPQPADQGNDVPDASPAQLVVDEGAIDLAPNTFSGAFELSNIGGTATAWQWVGDPRILVSASVGTLEAGESVVIDFQVDASQLQAGTNLLANCVVTADQAVDVWITATKVNLPSIPAQLTI
jgi:hypothetical protein